MTFTMCVVAAAECSFEVGQAMLQPLAVSTGLEFQPVDHVRFAAAETELGCVEFRFIVRQFVSPF